MINYIFTYETLYLYGITFIPFFTVLAVFFLHSYSKDREYKYIYRISNVSAILTLFLTFLIFCKYFSLLYSADLTTFNLIEIYKFQYLNVSYAYLLDSISLSFVLLTNFLTLLCLKIVSRYTKFVKQFFIIIFAIQFFCLQAFLVDNFFMFYVFFEAILIPMFFMIGIWGSHGRNIHAAFVFFLYTLFGSLLMLIGLAYLHTIYGSTSFLSFTENNLFSFINTESSSYLFDGNSNVNLILFILFFIAFAVKIPMFPAHIWLPEAHGEAPTVGSVILAGLLLKLGLYGMIRVLLPICIPSILALKSFVYLLCLLSIVYTSLTTLAQTDIKRVIAYSSVGHMNMAVLSLFSLSKVGFVGAVFSGISHGFVASGLFFCVGLLYDRFGTKLINYFGGVAVFMPVFATIFGFLSFANIAFPGTSAFASEFLMLIGIGSMGFVVLFLASLGVLLSAFYSIWLMNRILFGPYTNYKNVFMRFVNNSHTFSDLTITEIVLLLSLAFCIIFFGIYPSVITDVLNGFTFNFLLTLTSNLNNFDFFSAHALTTDNSLVIGTIFDTSKARFEQLYLGGAILPPERMAEFLQWQNERREFELYMAGLNSLMTYYSSVNATDSVFLVEYLYALQYKFFLLDSEAFSNYVISTYGLEGSHYAVIENKFYELWVEEALKLDKSGAQLYIYSSNHK